MQTSRSPASSCEPVGNGHIGSRGIGAKSPLDPAQCATLSQFDLPQYFALLLRIHSVKRRGFLARKNNLLAVYQRAQDG